MTEPTKIYCGKLCQKVDTATFLFKLQPKPCKSDYFWICLVVVERIQTVKYGPQVFSHVHLNNQ